MVSALPVNALIPGLPAAAGLESQSAVAAFAVAADIAEIDLDTQFAVAEVGASAVAVDTVRVGSRIDTGSGSDLPQSARRPVVALIELVSAGAAGAGPAAGLV